jgi:hypothetical protein
MKRYFIVIVMFVIGCISSANAQQGQQGQAVTLADVKALVKAGISDQIIINQIRNSQTVYHLNTADILDLNNSKVSEKIIDFMINTATTVAQVQPQAPTQVQTVQPASVIEAQQPPAVVDAVVVAPDDYIWVDGLWVWDGYAWGWRPGYWNRSFRSHAYGNGNPGYRDSREENSGHGNESSHSSTSTHGNSRQNY